MASMYGGQLPGIGLYGYLSIMGGALYMYPCLASVYVDGVCCLCVLYVFHSFDFYIIFLCGAVIRVVFVFLCVYMCIFG